MATYVVTGGAGFIGSNIAAALEGRGDDVIVVDRLGTGDKWCNISRLRLADIILPEAMPAAFDGAGGRIAAVLHMGAISSTVETDADLIVEANFRASCRLWDWCARRGVPLVYASSAATYGDGSAGFEDRDDAAYLARLQPLNAYGWSKHLFDRWAMARIARGDPRPPSWAGLKFFNVYGPNEQHKAGQRSTALQIYEQLAAGGPARLFKSYRPDYPDGGQLRDFVWVGDCVATALWLADKPGIGGLFNVGSGAARSFADLARAVGQAMGRNTEIQFIDMPESLRARYQYLTRADTRKLAAAGCPNVPLALEEGVRRYVQEHLATAGPA